ncbi:MAG: serine/threonine protein kinase [Rhizobacter sp.]
MPNKQTPSAAPDAEHLDNETPYEGLTPDVVLDALAEVGCFGDGRLIQLNSFENRVFQVFLEDKSVVVAKFYRPHRWSDAQILEEHAYAQELAAQDIPVIAPLSLTASGGAADTSTVSSEPNTLATVHTTAGQHRFSLSPRRSGRSPELEDPQVLEWIGRFIGRMHAVGQKRAFKHRRTLTVAEFGLASRDYLLALNVVSPEWQERWTSLVNAVLHLTQQRFDEVQTSVGAAAIRLHGDCHVGNVLWTESGPHFVDLDDAMMGPAVQDLWMLLSGDPQAAKGQLRALLAGYEQFMDFDDRELSLIEPLRSLRIIHYSAWLARRWSDPAFPAAFPWFGTSAYWSEQITQLQDQLDAMQED